MKSPDFLGIVKTMSKNSIELLPNLVVATIDENTKIGKTYAENYEESPLCPYGLNHYIELEYPDTLNYDIEKKNKAISKFYDSPDSISGTNRFSGVFLVSLLKVDKDFYKTDDYKRLLDYMKERKKDTKFVLLVSPVAPINNIMFDLRGFSDAELIQEYTKEDVLKHVKSVLDENGFSYNESLLKDIDPSPEAINTLTMKIRYYALTNSDKKVIDDTTLKAFVSNTIGKGSNPFGFN